MMNRMITTALGAGLLTLFALPTAVHAGPFELADGLAVPVSRPGLSVWSGDVTPSGPSPSISFSAPASSSTGEKILDALNLPGEFGFVVEHANGVAYYDGLAYRPSDEMQFEASWAYDDRQRGVSTVLGLRLNF